MKTEAPEESMTELAKMIAKKLRDEGWSLRDAEEEIGVSRSSLGNIVNEVDQVPRLETLEKIATYFGLPLFRVIQMAGIDLGLDRSVDETIQQLKSLARRLPEIEPIVQYLLKLYPEDLRGVVAYLESVDRQHNRNQGWSGDGTEPRQ